MVAWGEIMIKEQPHAAKLDVEPQEQLGVLDVKNSQNAVIASLPEARPEIRQIILATEQQLHHDNGQLAFSSRMKNL